LSHWKFFSIRSFKINFLKIFTDLFLLSLWLAPFLNWILWWIFFFFFFWFIKSKKEEAKITFLLIKKRTNNTSKIKAKIPTVTPIPIPIACSLWFFSAEAKLQVTPSPEYPSLHSQLKLPIVFVQSELTLHPPLFIKHSLISFYFIYLGLWLLFKKVLRKEKE